jgi:hypothetical protein
VTGKARIRNTRLQKYYLINGTNALQEKMYRFDCELLKRHLIGVFFR